MSRSLTRYCAAVVGSLYVAMLSFAGIFFTCILPFTSSAPLGLAKSHILLPICEFVSGQSG